MKHEDLPTQSQKLCDPQSAMQMLVEGREARQRSSWILSWCEAAATETELQPDYVRWTFHDHPFKTAIATSSAPFWERRLSPCLQNTVLVNDTRPTLLTREH